MPKYVIGLDFGTLSCRAVLVKVSSGKVIAQSIHEYRHGVIDYELNGIRLPENYALQDANDYTEALQIVVNNIMKESGVNPTDIIGIGSDFTSSTIMPIDKDGNPLSNHVGFENNKHAYVKLWKHHAAQSQADRITNLAIENSEEFINQYGGIISSEWLLPKVLQILEEDREIYDSTYSFIEAGDWINLQLTGQDIRSVCQAGFKGTFYDERFPSNRFLTSLNPVLNNLVEDKLGNVYLPPGSLVGGLNDKWSKLLNLPKSVAVSTSIIDAHSGMIGSGVVEEKTMFVAIGTSSCHIILDKNSHEVFGSSGYVKNGVIPGYYAYEAGQASVGDAFEWLVDLLRHPGESLSDVHKRLTSHAINLRPGSNGLLAIDWLNGSRTPYVNYDLSGAFIGLNLQTKPEELYRALIEATAFGTKQIVELYENQGIIVEKLIVSGGIAYKNKMLMQIYSDVLGRPIEVATSKQSAALGAAINASIAAGKDSGGYDDYSVAVSNMVEKSSVKYYPNASNVKKYLVLYNLYKKTANIYAKEHKEIMETLLTLRSN